MCMHVIIPEYTFSWVTEVNHMGHLLGIFRALIEPRKLNGTTSSDRTIKPFDL